MSEGIQPVQATIELFDAFTAPMMNIINAADLGANAIIALQNIISTDTDSSSLREMERSLLDAQVAAELFQEAIRGMELPEIPTPVSPEPVEIPIVWQSANSIEVFNTTGFERWRQEIASAQEMMDQLAQSQNRLTQNAVYGNILPLNAANDMADLNVRMDAMQRRITQISSRRLNTVSPSDIAEIEQLRMQLNRCLQLQNRMNSAVDSLDFDEANRAYLGLERAVGNTERFIRDNVSEQGNFNNEIRNGQNEADKLAGFLKKAAGNLLSINNVKKVVELSDEMTVLTARLDMINDGAQSTKQLLNMTYAAAENARGSLTGMADVIARFGNNAKDAFSSNAEVIAFSELIQKQMTIAGASTQEASNAMLQLSQAFGSGVLRGDELNSIFEQAPNIIQSIADYLDKPIGKIREMASNGEITAAVVKAAIFNSADDINTKFDKMPKTWGQVWQSMQNQAIMAMQPVLDKISEMADSEEVQEGITIIIDLVAVASEFAVELLGMVAEAAGYLSDNWSTIGPVIMGAAAAMLAFKAATSAAAEAEKLLANPELLIFAAVLGAIVAGVAAYTNHVNEAYGLSLSFGGMLGGFLVGMLAVLGNMVIGVANKFIMCFDNIWNTVAAFANFFANVFNNPVGAVWKLWEDLFTNAVDIILNITELIDNIFKTNWSEQLTNFRDDLVGKVRDKYGDEMDKNITVMERRNDHLKYINLDDAFETGYYFGDKLFGGDDPLGSEGITDGLIDMNSILENISANTDDINDSLDITEEDLKYLRDIAEQEAINRFTTASITIEQTNNNTISNDMDIDGIVNNLTELMGEAAHVVSEGAYDG